MATKPRPNPAVLASARDAGPDDWLTVPEAAALLSVGTTTLYAELRAGRLAHYRVGQKINIKKADLLAFLASCRVGPSPGMAAGGQDGPVT